MGAARAPVAGGQGQEGAGDPARKAQDMAVEGPGLNGQLLDVLRGNGYT